MNNQISPYQLSGNEPENAQIGSCPLATHPCQGASGAANDVSTALVILSEPHDDTQYRLHVRDRVDLGGLQRGAHPPGLRLLQSDQFQCQVRASPWPHSQVIPKTIAMPGWASSSRKGAAERLTSEYRALGAPLLTVQKDSVQPWAARLDGATPVGKPSACGHAARLP